MASETFEKLRNAIERNMKGAPSDPESMRKGMELTAMPLPDGVSGTASRSARVSSSSTMRRCSSGSDGPGTSPSVKARRTKTTASTSRIPPRNLFPRPSP